ncbi:hypothetical protein PG994_014291 [Apiospora phragmitis]|uniref:Uncharacterized protein n=1 Tax=Apiospora phragmitis TaxID=2905665 RepID=A0ABR1T5Y4_9PEZI
MEKIYAGARQAVVWLGEGVEIPNVSTDAAMDYLVTISKSKGEIESRIGNGVAWKEEYYTKLAGLFGSIDTRPDGWKILGGISFLFTRDCLYEGHEIGVALFWGPSSLHLLDSTKENPPEMPSWVPNLQMLTDDGLRGICYIRGASPEDKVDSSAVGLLFGAAVKHHGKLVKAQMEFSLDESLLTLKGIRIDRVCAVGRQAPKKPEDGALETGSR